MLTIHVFLSNWSCNVHLHLIFCNIVLYFCLCWFLQTVDWRSFFWSVFSAARHTQGHLSSKITWRVPTQTNPSDSSALSVRPSSCRSPFWTSTCLPTPPPLSPVKSATRPLPMFTVCNGTWSVMTKAQTCASSSVRSVARHSNSSTIWRSTSGSTVERNPLNVQTATRGSATLGHTAATWPPRSAG